jgi:dTDP-4-dehydrorhamnose 3,5-epimerase
VAINRQKKLDTRGSFTRLFCSNDLTHAGWSWPVAQINHSYTSIAGTVRGMHYQNPPNAEAKLVTCLRGKIWDVVVDLRVDSSTYLKWIAQELSAENQSALLIPHGFAHGFQTLSDDVELLYLHSAPHIPEAEFGLNPNDKALSIAWPLPISIISDKDSNYSMLSSQIAGKKL